MVKKYRNDPDNFSTQYKREMPTINISKDIEENIIKELSIEKNLIADVNVPLKTYNYSYIKNRLEIVDLLTGNAESVALIPNSE